MEGLIMFVVMVLLLSLLSLAARHWGVDSTTSFTDRRSNW